MRETARVAHSVLVVPVPGVEDFVVGRTLRYDASFHSRDPRFVHAHLTLLGPWLSAPDERDLAIVGDLAAAAEPFDYRLDEVAVFPEGIIHLVPEPAEPFAALTKALVAAFPECPPYAGAFPDSVPHVTLDREAPGISAASVRAELPLPVDGRATRIDLQWWDNDDCHVMASWPLGERR